MIPKQKVMEIARQVVVYLLVFSLFLSTGLGSLIPLVNARNQATNREQSQKITIGNRKQHSSTVNQVRLTDNGKASGMEENRDNKQQVVSSGGNSQKTNKNVISLSNSQYQILARIIQSEAGGEPFKGQVAVAAVLINRIKSGKFPKTISANVFRSGEFESVSNGYIWSNDPPPTAYKAATYALKGWDPTNGALYFYNPAKTSSRWIWNRPIYTRIGNHYFAG